MEGNNLCFVSSIFTVLISSIFTVLKEKFWNLRIDSLSNVKDPECDMSWGPARKPVAIRNTPRAFRRAAMDLALSMLLSYSKNVLLWLTIEQRLDVRPGKKALMTPGPSRWSRTGIVPCGRPPWIQSLPHKPTPPPQGERSCMALWFCFFLWCSSYSCSFTRWSGQGPFICSFLITHTEYA